MKYDVAIVGAGPCGYFAAYELTVKNPSLKIILIDRGLDIYKRRCPVMMHKIEKCPVTREGIQECYPACAITNGFGGAGAYSDGKFNITTEFGGWLTDYIDDDELLKLIKYVDDVNLKFGATNVVTDPYTAKIKELSPDVKIYTEKGDELDNWVDWYIDIPSLEILLRLIKDLDEDIIIHRESHGNPPCIEIYDTYRE